MDLQACMYVCLRPPSMYVCMSQVAKHVCMSQVAKHVCMYVCLEPPEVPPLTNLKKLKIAYNTNVFRKESDPAVG